VLKRLLEGVGVLCVHWCSLFLLISCCAHLALHSLMDVNESSFAPR
jgi:hypothetical protein